MLRIIEFEDTKEFYKGHNAESIIAYLWRQDGYYVVITADYKERGRNGAPGARNNDDFITLPDLDVAKQGYRGYVEVKYKSKPDWTRITQRYEHGIGQNKFGMYKQAQEQFGTVVILCIYEGNSGAVLFSPIDELEPLARLYNGNKMDRGGMIFFSRASFDLWGKVAECNGDIYRQLGLFETIEQVENGDKFFQVIRHYANPTQP